MPVPLPVPSPSDERSKRLYDLILMQNEEAIAREKARERKAAERAATEKLAKGLQEAADDAKKAEVEEASREAKELLELAHRESLALKEKHEAAEAAKKKSEEEAPLNNIRLGTHPRLMLGASQYKRDKSYDLEGQCMRSNAILVKPQKADEMKLLGVRQTVFPTHVSQATIIHERTELTLCSFNATEPSGSKRCRQSTQGVDNHL